MLLSEFALKELFLLLLLALLFILFIQVNSQHPPSIDDSTVIRHLFFHVRITLLLFGSGHCSLVWVWNVGGNRLGVGSGMSCLHELTILESLRMATDRVVSIGNLAAGGMDVDHNILQRALQQAGTPTSGPAPLTGDLYSIQMASRHIVHWCRYYSLVDLGDQIVRSFLAAPFSNIGLD